MSATDHRGHPQRSTTPAASAGSNAGHTNSPRIDARLALSVQEACEALGVSWDFWREHVEPGLRIVRCGRRKLIAVSELEAWLEANAERALPDATGIHARSAREVPANRGVRASRAPAGRAA